MSDKLILAIESSHDDSSFALYKSGKLIWEETISQSDFHKKFGGTVPEFASRGHFVNLFKLIKILKTKIELKDIDFVAYTALPGLIGSLQMGRLVAYGISNALNIPIVPVNHMHGHIYAVEFNHEIIYPAVSLIVSGGHTQLWYLKNEKELKIIGETKDDAIGEVYDKIARRLKLGFPGGPFIDKAFENFDGEYLNFGLVNKGGLDFSFSGLKTKVINYINSHSQKGDLNVEQVAASFQYHAIKYLISKTKSAIEKYNPACLTLGGGVSANKHLRSELLSLHKNVLIPDLKYTTDNAAMIAARCAHMLKHEIK